MSAAKEDHLTSRAVVWPTKPAACFSAVPSLFNPRPLICVWAAVRFSRLFPLTSLIWTMSAGFARRKMRRKSTEATVEICGKVFSIRRGAGGRGMECPRDCCAV